MLSEHQFAYEEVLPSWFPNALGHFLSTMADGLTVTFSGANITVPAGPGDQAAVVAVEGLWRYAEAAITRAHPGGAAGTYPIFATAAANSINGTTDNTNYSFNLAIVAPGATPSIVAGTVDVFREIGTCAWSGSAITSVNQTVPAIGGAASINDPRLTNARTPVLHAATHSSAGDDEVTPAAIGTLTTQQIDTLVANAVSGLASEASVAANEASVAAEFAGLPVISWGVISTGSGTLVAGSGDWTPDAFSPGTRITFNKARSAGRMVAVATPVGLNAGTASQYTAQINIANSTQIVIYGFNPSGNAATGVYVAFACFG